MATSKIPRNVVFGEFKSKTNNSDPHYYFFANVPSVYLAVLYPYNSLSGVSEVSVYLICVAGQSDLNYYAIMERNDLKITGVTLTGNTLDITWGGGGTSRIFLCPLSNT